VNTEPGRSTINHKHLQALLYISLAIIGVIILALGLPDLRFQAGSPIPGAETGSTVAQTIDQGSSSLSSPWWFQFVLAFGIILLFFALIIALRNKVKIKQVGLLAATLILLFLLFSSLPQPQSEPVDSNPSSAYAEPPPSLEYTISPIGEPPAGLLLWVTAALLLGSVTFIVWFASHSNQRTDKEDPMAVEAKAALQAIKGGQNLRDIIIHCYLEMERLIAQERGIERGEAVTPREFETHLLDKGIPRVPIFQLTHLFEKARYGNQNLNKLDEQEAMNCFFAIQEACQPGQREIQ
jgi:hypothetical protein